MKKALLSALFLLLSFPGALANVTPSDTIKTVRLYKVYWSGIHVADLRAEVKDGGVDAVIESYGIAKKVSKYESKFSTKFGYIDGEFVPYSYFTEFSQRHGSKTIDIKYDKNGGITQEEITPPDNRGKRPAVDDELKHNTVDPLTAFMVARQKVKESLLKGQDKFSLKMYDGRRLASLDFVIEGRYERKINEVNQKIVKVTFKRKPIKGFTRNELDRMQKEEPKFTLYLSDDENLLPVKADADAPVGTAVMLLDKECSSMDECV